jgi:protein-disulfide isomerase
MSRTPQTTAPSRFPAGTTEDGDGVVLGDGLVRVDAYIDFQCPFCRQFEMGAGQTLRRLLGARAIHLVYHPVAFLDRLSTTAYSSRASAASGCASDGGRFAEFKDALFANQPPEGGPGLSDEQLIGLGRAAGLDDEFARCVAAGAHLPWTAYVTGRAIERGVQGTPTTFVAGAPVPANAALIAAAVQDAAAQIR